MISEARVRGLLEDEFRGRARFAQKRTRTRGVQAAMELLNRAHRGDPATLQALAEPPIHYLFGSLWTARLLPDHDPSGVAGRYLRQGDLGDKRTGAALAALIGLPAAEELTPAMRKVVAVAAAFGRHPLAQNAQAKILASGDQELVDEVCAWATELPDLAPFCREHRLAPSDPRRRPLFWLLTGQVELYESVDPSGVLARAAYAEADGPLRDRLEQATLRAGLFDLVRRFPGTRVRGDDDELRWQLLKRVPMADAVQLARQITETWQPPDAGDRRLLAVFRAAPVETVAATAEDPALLRLLRFESHAVAVGMGRAHAAGFLELPGGGHRMEVADLRTGEVRSQLSVETVGIPRRVVPCSPSAVVWLDDAGLWSCSPDGQVRLSPEVAVRLVASAEGWAAVTPTELLLGTAGGRLSRSVQLADLRLRGDQVPDLAVSDDGARLLLQRWGRTVQVDCNGTSIAVRRQTAPEPWTPAANPLLVPGRRVVATHGPRSADLRLYDLLDDERDRRAAAMEYLRLPLSGHWRTRRPLLRTVLAPVVPDGDDPCLKLLRVVSEVLDW